MAPIIQDWVDTARDTLRRFGERPDAIKIVAAVALLGLAIVFAITLAPRKPQPLAPILTLVSANDVEKVREAVARHKGHLREADFDGNTPLHIAAMLGSAEMVDALLAAGADAGAKNYDGETPLDAAVRTGRKKIVRLLQNPAAREASAG